MHILLCNERFLFRYGVDRVLLIMANYLRKRGDTVSIMGINIDVKVANKVADHVIQIPHYEDYYNLNEYVNEWLEKNWDEQFKDIGTPDLVLNCGWPFFAAMPLMKQKTKGVIFHDYGIVPIYEYTGGTLMIQEKVRDMRRRYMPYSTYVIGISNYVTKTTYEIQEHHNIPIKTIHLGVNHMEMNLWNENEVNNTSASRKIDEILKKLKGEDKKIILNLGRWENVGYKNSKIMYKVIRDIRIKLPSVVLLTLAQSSDMNIPEDLKDVIYPLGFVSDEDLVRVMKNADLGIAPTLWEGFDLPLAEMQYYEKPVLVFDIGAHPEVVIHPWYLCGNLTEMVEKAIMSIENRDLKPWIKEDAYRRFCDYFTWEKSIQKCYEVFEKVLSNAQYEVPIDEEFVENHGKTISVIMDMSNPAKDPANPGIIRVCRRLAAELQKYLDPIFVIWSDPDKEYVMPTLHEYQIMGTYNGPILFDSMRLSPDEYRIPLTKYLENKTSHQVRWLFLPDIIFADKGFDIKKYCLKNGFLMADIFYDDIPYKLKDIYTQESQDEHAKYMMRLSDSQFVSSISRYSTECLREFWKKVGITKANISTIEIPGEFNSIERVKEAKVVDLPYVQFLCVSTLEPRKNHKVLIDSCLLLKKKYPDLKFKLVMIGNKYPGHFDIAEYAEKVSQYTDEINWLGVVSDDILKEEMRKSSFTVYPSKMEGYGMPIMESIWQGKPCLCSSEGAMGELAEGGGCVTTDVNSVDAMAECLYRMCTDSELIEKLTQEAISRPIITWKEYALNTLKQFVKEEKSFLGDKLPDRKYGEVVHKAVMDLNNINQIIIESILKKMNHVVVVSIGNASQNTLRIIDQNSEFTIAFLNHEVEIKDAKMFKNLIMLEGEYESLKYYWNTFSDKNLDIQSCCIINVKESEPIIDRIISEKFYDKIVLLNCLNAYEGGGYNRCQVGNNLLLLEKMETGEIKKETRLISSEEYQPKKQINTYEECASIDDINNLYKKLLNRELVSEEKELWRERDVSKSEIVFTILNSEEFEARRIKEDEFEEENLLEIKSDLMELFLGRPIRDYERELFQNVKLSDFVIEILKSEERKEYRKACIKQEIYEEGFGAMTYKINWKSPTNFTCVYNESFRDVVTTEVRKGRTGIWKAQHQLLKYFPENGTFIDMGANIGVMSCMYESKGWNGYAIEASKKNADCIRKAVVLNDLNIEVGNFAISNETKMLRFLENGPWGWIENEVSVLEGEPEDKAFADVKYNDVQAYALDDWGVTGFSEPDKITFIKMDIEGSEILALRGMYKFLQKYDYPVIFCESNGESQFNFGFTTEELRKEFLKLGYHRYEWENGKLILCDKKKFQLIYSTDFLFIKHMPEYLKTFIEDEKIEHVTSQQILRLLTDGSKAEKIHVCSELKDFLDYLDDEAIVECLDKYSKVHDKVLNKATEWFRVR